MENVVLSIFEEGREIIDPQQVDGQTSHHNGDSSRSTPTSSSDNFQLASNRTNLLPACRAIGYPKTPSPKKSRGSVAKRSVRCVLRNPVVRQVHQIKIAAAI